MGAPRTLRWAGIVFGGLLLAYGLHYGVQIARIGAAHKAKVLCSAAFVSHRDLDQVLSEDLGGALEWVRAEIDLPGRLVSAWLPGLPSQRALYREGLGCTLLTGVSEEDLRNQVGDVTPTAGGAAPETADALPTWGVDAPAGVSPAGLEAALADAFSEPVPGRPRRTRAVVVVYRGKILAEGYGEGVGPDTPLPGWSMAKSVTNALVGILVGRGRLDLHAPAPVPEWQGDERAAITLNHLLGMSTGLRFDDRSGPVVSDVNRMLLLEPDAAAFAASKPLEHEPGTRWQYASGTTNILSRVVRHAVGGNLEDYWRFPREALFGPLGMTSAVWEPDPSGTFVGSSYLYATARDWARFGLLYLQDGVWEGRRILPEGWVSYTMTPAPAARAKQYGAHFWLRWGNRKGTDAGEEDPWPDALYASGYEAQFVVIVPKRDLVVVRLGQTPDFDAWDMEAFVEEILAALGEPR